MNVQLDKNEYLFMWLNSNSIEKFNTLSENHTYICSYVSSYLLQN